MMNVMNRVVDIITNCVIILIEIQLMLPSSVKNCKSMHGRISRRLLSISVQLACLKENITLVAFS
jgi:hypothetical protein